MKSWQCALFASGFLIASTALGQPPSPTAVFGFGLDDTSLQGQQQGPQTAEAARLDALDSQLKELLVKSGCCEMADLSTVAPQTRNISIWSCNGCDVDFARKAGARISVTGWVQKVSNLILNINLVARDVATGKVIAAGSVDIRGNTGESWSRGLAYLLQDRLRPAEWR